MTPQQKLAAAVQQVQAENNGTAVDPNGLDYKRKEAMKEVMLQLCEMVEVVLVQNHMMKNPNQMIAGNVNIQKLGKLLKKIEAL